MHSEMDPTVNLMSHDSKVLQRSWTHGIEGVLGDGGLVTRVMQQLFVEDASGWNNQCARKWMNV
ncbi:hypothetical protein M404DRAFT_1000308 [Pisolithus tinctorius Marx 270]|uniref:Uncharacterized protein n=1 Tax=Pisolithus tinctorius Marx 270 TaxID=870435 RepID=A0A0C3K5C2_PISTI|nr:hypothetical protein M404DRAFT_1000308 [Pisolithus tinctorius Marx 270]